MMKEIAWSDHTEHLRKALSDGGAFLVVADGGGKANPMTIGWGTVGRVWKKPVFTVLVRRSRYTHDCILNSNCFTVNVPRLGQLKEELLFCGTKSGRDFDKAAECNLTLVPGKTVGTPVIEECALHYECRVVVRKQLQEDDFILDDVLGQNYPTDDHHLVIMGEILSAYAESDL
jgi:flavin reductase (DIM6/NTAB) family NADH-FMN oxidoreductase RutF